MSGRRDRGRARRLGQPRPDARRPARLAAGRRRDVRGADDGPAGAADGGAHRGRRRRPPARTSSTCCAGAGVDLMLDPPRRRRPSSTTGRRPAGRIQVCHAVGRAARRPGDARRRGRRRARWSLVPVAGEVGDEWAAAIPDGALVAVGWQGFLRDLAAGRAGRAPAARPSAVVAPGGPGRRQPARPRARDQRSRRSATFLHPGADLLVTQGQPRRAAGHRRSGRPARDAPLPADRDRPARSTRPAPATRSSRPCWRRCCGRRSWAGRAARRRPDLRFAAAAGSLAVEGPGLAGVPDRAAVLVRRARERVRRAVVPSEASQVGTGGLDPD